jgi:hypothetical protein
VEELEGTPQLHQIYGLYLYVPELLVEVRLLAMLQVEPFSF